VTTGSASTPAALAARLFGWSVAVVAVQALVIAGLGPMAIGLRTVAAAEHRAIALLVSLALALGLGAIVAQTAIRARPLYRAIVRTARDPDAPPPSRAAVTDVLYAPRRALVIGACVWLGGLIALAVAVDADPLARAHACVLTAGAAFAGATAVVVSWRRTLGEWLRALPASEIRPLRWEPYRERAAFHATVNVASIGLLASGAAAGPAPSLAVGLATTAVAAGVAGLCARRRARALEEDVERVVGRLRALGEGAGRDLAAHEGAGLDDGVTEPIAVDLARAVAVRMRSAADAADVEQKARRSLEEVQRTKTMFMASMSHDLRSPLNSILGFSELLLSGIGGPLSDAQRESVALIRRSGAQLLELLNDIIDAARFGAGRMPLRRAWTPSVEILTEAVRQGREMIEQRAGAKPFAIETRLQPGLPPLFVDRERVVQAVVCLFRHATHAMDGGTITLEARVSRDEGDERVLVDVSDEGGGLREPERERIFHAFRAMTSLSGRRIGGLGLSLALASSLVRAHGGDLSFRARPRTGTTFSVSIPTAKQDLP
jgi:signal transduction histidine kinase